MSPDAPLGRAAGVVHSSTGRARMGWLACLAVVFAAACSGTSAPQDVTVAIDGGSAEVALVGDAVVAAAPGATVTVRHATTPREGDEAPVTHTLVGGYGGALPRVFVRGGGGIVPNPAVWGPCQGGEVSQAVGQCPMPAVEGAQAWDGSSYWSLGAMLPGEQRDLPLADDLADGDYPFACALHPRLRLIVRIGGEGDGDGEAAPSADAGQRVTAALQQAEQAAAAAESRQVSAGVEIHDPAAYVAAFAPEVVRITVGESVTWRAAARAPVDVVFGADHEELSLSHTTPQDGLPAGEALGWDGGGELRSGFLAAGPVTGAENSEWTVTFTRPGTYDYASRFSDQMRGTVVVEEDPG